jgi:2-(1,2-epoxy-1,2-dihydrophenyl)acetyl-CoA isomerase
LQQFVGIGKAMEWALLAPTLSASEAERWGLVNRVVPVEKLEAATQEWAQEFVQGPTLIYGYTKSAIVHGWEESSIEAAYEHQGQALQYAFQTEDFAEGRKAFLEKRPPKFRGW